MTAETLNGIDVPALEAIADGVKNNPDQRMVAFRVKTEWKGADKECYHGVGRASRVVERNSEAYSAKYV